jgi:hypothetical protein
MEKQWHAVWPGDVLVPNHASVPSYVYPLSCCLRHHPAFSLDKAVIERVTRAAMFDVSDTQRSEWNRHLHYLPTEARKKKHRSAAGGVESQWNLTEGPWSHAVHNAFFDVNFFLWGVVFGHVSWCDAPPGGGHREILLSVFLEPLSDTILGTLTIMFPNCLVPKPIVVSAGERSPCQFHPGLQQTHPLIRGTHGLLLAGSCHADWPWTGNIEGTILRWLWST